jgi:hypothetical protein
MTRFIQLNENHRSHDKLRIEKLWSPGPYMVPGQMPDAVADEAIRLGRAKVIERPAKQEGAGTAPAETFPTEQEAVQPGSRGRRGRRSKGAAPENKAEMAGETLHRGGDGTVADE